MSKNWALVAVRGVAAIIFGVLALALPGITLLALVLLFGSYAIVDGILNIVAAVRRQEGRGPWWLLVIEGVVSLGAGVVTFVMPGLTALLLMYLIGAWAIITGALEVAAAIRLRKEITNEWWLVLSGVLSIVFGGLVMLVPGAGALAMVLWIGAYSIVFGACCLASPSDSAAGAAIKTRCRWHGPPDAGVTSPTRCCQRRDIDRVSMVAGLHARATPAALRCFFVGEPATLCETNGW